MAMANCGAITALSPPMNTSSKGIILWAYVDLTRTADAITEILCFVASGNEWQHRKCMVAAPRQAQEASQTNR
jgi:hypothetical protein